MCQGAEPLHVELQLRTWLAEYKKNAIGGYREECLKLADLGDPVTGDVLKMWSLGTMIAMGRHQLAILRLLIPRKHRKPKK